MQYAIGRAVRPPRDMVTTTGPGLFLTLALATCFIPFFGGVPGRFWWDGGATTRFRVEGVLLESLVRGGLLRLLGIPSLLVELEAASFLRGRLVRSF